MPSSSWGHKLTCFVKQPPFFMAQDLLDKIPGRPFQLAKFFVLELSKPLLKAFRGFGIVREGLPSDVARMCLLENKKEVFFKRFKDGEFCAVAVHNEQLVGYAWFSNKPFHVEDRFGYRLIIPEESIYAYDLLIKQEYRLRGIWVLFQKYIIENLERFGRERILTIIDYGNNVSIKAHLRFGYVILRSVVFIRCFGKRFFLETSVDRLSFNPKKVIK